MDMFTRKYFIDLTERVLATAAQAAVGVLAVEASTTLPQEAWWAVPIAAGLSFLKGVLAKFVGNQESASLSHDV